VLDEMANDPGMQMTMVKDILFGILSGKYQIEPWWNCQDNAYKEWYRNLAIMTLTAIIHKLSHEVNSQGFRETALNQLRLNLERAGYDPDTGECFQKPFESKPDK
jgi:hypothetical protein